MDHLYLFQWHPIVWPHISTDGGGRGEDESCSSCGLGALETLQLKDFPQTRALVRNMQSPIRTLWP